MLRDRPPDELDYSRVAICVAAGEPRGQVPFLAVVEVGQGVRDNIQVGW